MTVFAHNAELLQRFREGERQALSTVYWHYVDSVAGRLRRSLAVAARPGHVSGPSADLADVVQDVFVKAFATQARLAYDPSREYAPFLMAIARNTLIDYLRRASREVRLDVAAIERIIDASDQGAGDASPWADPQTMVLVDRYVASLTADERGVYLERYVRCHSQELAAQTLGMSRQQVRTVEGRLRTGLARELARARLSVSRGALRSPDSDRALSLMHGGRGP
jgi:RNA polymerase sigma factor (sigma-70 family)